MIINTETHELESPRQIRQATGISLPRNPGAETLAQLDPPRAYIVESEPPQGDVVEPTGFEQGEDGQWRQAWEVRDFTEEEKAAQLETKRRGMVVSKAQAHIALHNAGLYQQVVDMMNDPDTDPVAVIAWQTASEYSRLSPNLLAVRDGLGLTDEQLDELFEQAAQIVP